MLNSIFIEKKCKVKNKEKRHIEKKERKKKTGERKNSC